MKIAFIVQRYGTEILGGAEYHCRLTAERLADHHQVDVLTTCARDYITWENVYPEGTDRIRGVTVRRFANARTRDIASFNQYCDWIYNNKHTAADEMEWLKQQGPWSPGLIDYLEDPDADAENELYDTGINGLRLIPAGNMQDIGAEYLSSFRMRKLVNTLRSRFPHSHLFLDSPPVLGSPDARTLADLADVVILVAGYGRDTPARISEAAANFDPEKFAGVVFNEGV